MADATKELEIVLRLKDELSGKIKGVDEAIRNTTASYDDLRSSMLRGNDEAQKEATIRGKTISQIRAEAQEVIRLANERKKRNEEALREAKRLADIQKERNSYYQKEILGQGQSNVKMYEGVQASKALGTAMRGATTFSTSLTSGLKGVAGGATMFAEVAQDVIGSGGTMGSILSSLTSPVGLVSIGISGLALGLQALPNLFDSTSKAAGLTKTEMESLKKELDGIISVTGKPLVSSVEFKDMDIGELSTRWLSTNNVINKLNEDVYKLKVNMSQFYIPADPEGYAELQNKLKELQSDIVIMTNQRNVLGDAIRNNREQETANAVAMSIGAQKTKEQTSAVKLYADELKRLEKSPDKGGDVDERLLDAKNNLRLKKKERDETLMLTRVFDTQYNGIQGISDAELAAIRLAGIERQKEQDKALQKELQILQAKQDAVQRFGTAVSGYLADWVLNGERLSTVLSRAAEYFERKILETVADKAVQALLGKVLGGGSGFLGSILGWLGWADGGYTGSGGRNEVAGVVHKGEYVIPQSIVQSSPQLISSIENKRTGYASGGMVGGNTININITADSTSSGKRIVKEIQGYMRQIGVNTLAEIPARA